MIKHLFKLIWNKKKQNFLLMSEILFSFLVLFAVFSLIVYYYHNYKKSMGFDYDHVWVINYNNTLQTSNTDSLTRFYETIRQNLRSMPEIKAISYTGIYYPFSNGRSETGLTYEHKQINHVSTFTVEDDYKELFHLKVLEGRWFDKRDAVTGRSPVVINASLKKTFFPGGAAIGKRIGDWEVIGVVEDIKAKGDYSDIGNAIFTRVDTGSFHWMNNILIRVSPDAGAAFEGQLYKAMTGAMKNANVDIQHLSDKRQASNSYYTVPLIIILIVAGFLIINVALGLFGVLWYNINKRKGEIGLRRAIGATSVSVSTQMAAEALILATFSLIIGVFFAIQVPLLNLFDVETGVYLSAMLLDILFIYILVLICSLYPGRQAAGILPATALHED